MKRANVHTQKFPHPVIALALATAGAALFAYSAPVHARAVTPVEIYAGDLNRMVKIAGSELSPADIIGMSVVGPDGIRVGRVVGIEADEFAGNRVVVEPGRELWARTAMASLIDGVVPGPERLAGAVTLSPSADPDAHGDATGEHTVALAPTRFGRSDTLRHVLTVDRATANVIGRAGHPGALVY